MVIAIVIGVLGTIPQRLGKGTERFRNERTTRDHSDYSIIKISQNTEKSPGCYNKIGTIYQTLLVRVLPVQKKRNIDSNFSESLAIIIICIRL